MATTRPFGRLNAKQPIDTAPKPINPDGMIPSELDTDRRPNLNPKTQSVGKLGALARKRKTTSTYA